MHILRKSATVSVIIPTRNSLRWLPHAIGSVGDDPDVEIIVVDDDSTDGTRNWLFRRSLDEPRLLILHDPGPGPARARNLAIAAATAPLVAFLDPDASWHPGKLGTQLRLHRDHPDLALSFTGFRRINEAGDEVEPCPTARPDFAVRQARLDRPFLLGEDRVAQIYAADMIATSTVMARTDLLREAGGFDSDLPSAADWDLWLRLAELGPAMCVPEVLTDELVRTSRDVLGSLRARVLGMHMIAARHGEAARRQSRQADSIFTARLLAAEAAVAEASGRRWSSVGLRVRVLLRRPGWQAASEALAALRRATELVRPERFGIRLAKCK